MIWDDGYTSKGVTKHHKANFTHTHDFTFQLAISTFDVITRSDPTTAAALSSSERLALAAIGRCTSRATNDHAAARFRARRVAGPARSPRLGFAHQVKQNSESCAVKMRCP